MTTKQIQVDSNMANSNAEIRTSRLLAVLQDVIVTLFEENEIGYSVTKSLGLMWIVSKYQIEIHRTPAYLDTLTINAWTSAYRHNIYEICFEIFDNGEKIIDGLSNWILLNHDDHSIHQSNESRLPLEKRDFSVRRTLRVRPVDEPTETDKCEKTAVWSMCDMNSHMNNTKYIDACEDMLDTEYLMSHHVSRAEISFRREIQMNEKFTVNMSGRDDKFYFEGLNDDEKFVARLEFSES